jgi:hypothetical protein
MQTRPAAVALVGAIVAVLILVGAQPARANIQLPIIDIQPVVTWATMSDAIVPNGSNVNGAWDLTGSATLPLAKGLNFTYIHAGGGLLDETLARQTEILPPPPSLPSTAGKTVYFYPGNYHDFVEQYQLSQSINAFTIDLGLANRHRICCPGSSDPNQPASTEWHTGYLGLSWASPPMKSFLNSFVVLNMTVHTANHDQSPIVAKELGSLSIGSVREWGTTQAATIVVPVDPKHGFDATGTFAWGAADYFQDGAFPWMYDIFVATITKHFNPYFSLTMKASNLFQRPQGNPFMAPGGIQLGEADLTADFHVDLNKIIKK